MDHAAHRDSTYEDVHRNAREHPERWLFARGFHLVLLVVMRTLFGLRVFGAENLPKVGAAILVPNHKSYFDAPVLLAASPRRLRGMGKAEIFRGSLGRFLVAIGGFPVRRGDSDRAAMETAALLLAKGEAVAIFPEGTRVRDPEVLGTPKRGAARLAIEANCPIVPVAIDGLDKRRLPLPRRVSVTFGEPITPDVTEATPEAASALLDGVVWPAVEAEYQRSRMRPGLVAVGLAAVGVTIVVRRRRKGAPGEP